MRRLVGVMLAFGLVGGHGCSRGVATSEPSCPDGAEKCPCYGNGTCDGELVCLSGLCVDGGSLGGEGGGEAAAGNGGDGAEAGAPEAVEGGEGGSDNATGGAPTSGGGTAGGAAGAEEGGVGGCTSHADCEGAAICAAASDTCQVVTCTTYNECALFGAFCDHQRGVCVAAGGEGGAGGCYSHDDCAPGRICVATVGACQIVVCGDAIDCSEFDATCGNNPRVCVRPVAGTGGAGTGGAGTGGVATGGTGTGGAGTGGTATGGTATGGAATGGSNTGGTGTGGSNTGGTATGGVGGEGGSEPACLPACTPELLGFGEEAVNLVVFEDATASGCDTEGRMWVGGNATLSGYGVGAQLEECDADGYVLVVGGDLSVQGGIKGRIWVGGEHISGTAQCGGVYGPEDPPVDFAALEEELTEYSNVLASYPVNGTNGVAGNGAIVLTGTASDINVFTVSGADFTDANGFVIDTPETATAIVNVTGPSAGFVNGATALPDGVTCGSGAVQLDDFCNRLIWNFSEATSVRVSGTVVQGSLLAPHADFGSDGSGQVNGTVVVRNFEIDSCVEIHPHYFNGCLCSDDAGSPYACCP